MNLLIWWTDQEAATAADTTHLPEYLKTQIESRSGRGGRGRLWVDKMFGHVGVDPWPDTPLSALLAGDYAGVVFAAEDLDSVKDLPGIITDFELTRV